MKSASICPFMAVRKQYYTSNSHSSIAYSTICSIALRLLIARRRGLSVRTMIVWAWKYGFNVRAIVTKAKASFSIGGYLSSVPQSA